MTAPRRKALQHSVEIPKWIPFDLRDEFLDVAAERGEEYAASHIRELKWERERAATARKDCAEEFARFIARSLQLSLVAVAAEIGDETAVRLSLYGHSFTITKAGGAVRD